MSAYHQNPPPSLLSDYGCTVEQWRDLRNIGLAMMKAGATKETTPLKAFCHQRHSAITRRNIEWKLSLMEWWRIWQASGHWHERGRGRGWHMCRNGDTGPYALGNVHIGPGAENLSASAKKCDLPIGVVHNKKSRISPYLACCSIDGKRRHLGSFRTVEAARAAYLKALEFDLALKAAPAMRSAA